LISLHFVTKTTQLIGIANQRFSLSHADLYAVAIGLFYVSGPMVRSISIHGFDCVLSKNVNMRSMGCRTRATGRSAGYPKGETVAK